MHSYDGDVVAWAEEQARLLREGRFSELDIEHLAEEIEDVGKSEQRELASRMVVLLAHLLKWRYQPERQGASWRCTIRTQRHAIGLHLADVPSLKPKLRDDRWLSVVWGDAVALAMKETGLEEFPEDLPWTMAQVLDAEYWP